MPSKWRYALSVCSFLIVFLGLSLEVHGKVVGNKIVLPPLVNEIPQPQRLVAIGDIHGDGEALQYILFSLGLIDIESNWIGGNTVLVMVGDLLDRGQTSRLALDLLMRLERQAEVIGGSVQVLLGNHEFMVLSGDLRYFSKKDAENYMDFAQKGDTPEEIINRAFSLQSKYGKWLSGKSTVLKVGDTIFAHAGIHDWVYRYSISAANHSIRRWILHFQGVIDRPGKEEEWSVGPAGPLWTRDLATKKVSTGRFESWINALEAKRLVIGHTIVEDALQPVALSVYGNNVIMIDTAISKSLDGKLSALIIERPQEKGAEDLLSAYSSERPDEQRPREEDLWRAIDGIGYRPPNVEPRIVDVSALNIRCEYENGEVRQVERIRLDPSSVKNVSHLTYRLKPEGLKRMFLDSPIHEGGNSQIEALAPGFVKGKFEQLGRENFLRIMNLIMAPESRLFRKWSLVSCK